MLQYIYITSNRKRYQQYYWVRSDLLIRFPCFCFGSTHSVINEVADRKSRLYRHLSDFVYGHQDYRPWLIQLPPNKSRSRTLSVRLFYAGVLKFLNKVDIPDQIYSSISDRGAGLNKFIPRSEDFIETLKYSVEGTPDCTFISCSLTHDELLNVSSEIRIELMDIRDKTHVKDPLPMNSIDLSLLLPSIAAILFPSY